MRGPLESREFDAGSGLLSRADGSGSFGYGTQTSLASVTGPIEVRLRDEITDSATLQFIFVPLDGSAGIAAGALGTELLNLFKPVVLLHHHPRTQIQVTVQTTSVPPAAAAIAIDSSSSSAPLLLGPDTAILVSEVAAAINASTMALLDGGIPMKATVVAASCAVMHPAFARRASVNMNDNDDWCVSTNSIVVDPSPEEEAQAKSCHVFAFAISGIDPTAPGKTDAAVQLVYSSGTGPTSMQTLKQLIQIASDVALDTQAFMRSKLVVLS